MEISRKQCVTVLATAVASHRFNSVRQRAAWALGRIGPVASAALQSLETAAASNDARLARLAQRAMTQIKS